MPIYQYKCELCGVPHEALQRMSDPLLTTCPSCGQEGLKKQITAAAFKLKGTGWYETDFKHSGAKPKAATTADKTEASTGDTGSKSVNESADSASASNASEPSKAPEVTQKSVESP